MNILKGPAPSTLADVITPFNLRSKLDCRPDARAVLPPVVAHVADKEVDTAFELSVIPKNSSWSKPTSSNS
eukprot:2653535-Pyramimonas_sp.AAC.1